MVPEWMEKMTNLWYPYILFRPTGFPAPKIMKIFGFPVFWIWKYLKNWQHRNKEKQNTIYVGHHYAQTNTNNLNKQWTLIQITGGKEESNVVFMKKS
jgi:hypothetical protein